jgi:hypothetical protein
MKPINTHSALNAELLCMKAGGTCLMGLKVSHYVQSCLLGCTAV